MSIVNPLNQPQASLDRNANQSFKSSRSFKSISKTNQKSSTFLNRRKENSSYVQVSEFLLGGNITDPLNLSGLTPNDNKQTPINSPQQHNEIEVLIPADLNDPLKLNACESSDDICHLLISPNKKMNRRLKRKRTESDSILDELKDDKKMKIDFKTLKSNLINDKVCKPTNRFQTNQPNSHLNFKSNVNSSSLSQIEIKSQDNCTNSKLNSKATKLISKKKPFIFTSNQNKFYYANGHKFNLKDQKFQFGNYNRYYGYRNGSNSRSMQDDPRLSKFDKEWFLNKHVLDVGCNVGHVTLAIARDFKPSKITGIDIDSELIRQAKISLDSHLKSNTLQKELDKFPTSLAICHGPLLDKANKGDDKVKELSIKEVNTNEQENNQENNDRKVQDNQDKKEENLDLVKVNRFPNNVNFISANYVLPNDDLLSTQKPEYDCILCLSVTKWIHLNFGDLGLKRMFKRMYLQLKPNGRLILEPQQFWSYKRRKALTETTLKNYNLIKLKPEMFKDYLLSDEIGFRSCELIEPPNNDSKGFQRSIYIFQK